MDVLKYIYIGCFMTCGYYCRRWFPRSLWSKNFIYTCVYIRTYTQSVYSRSVISQVLAWTIHRPMVRKQKLHPEFS